MRSLRPFCCHFEHRYDYDYNTTFLYFQVNGKWELGLITCLVWTGCDVFLSTTSIMHLCAIAIHRFLGISYPLHFRSNQGKKHIFVLLITVWFMSFAISLPLIVQGARNQEHVLIDLEDLGPQCGIFDHTFAIYSSIVSFFLPLSIMVVADIRSVEILRNNCKVSIFPTHNLNRSRSRSPCSKDTSAYELTESEVGSTAQSPMMEYRCNDTTSEQNLVNSTQTTPRSEDVPSVTVNLKPLNRNRSKSIGYIGMLAARGMIKINSRERRAEKTLIWVFVCFVVLWLPFFCTNLTYGICKTCNIPADLFLFFTWLGYISSGVNPCIYTFLNKDFRNAFKKLLLCRATELRRKSTT